MARYFRRLYSKRLAQKVASAEISFLSLVGPGVIPSLPDGLMEYMVEKSHTSSYKLCIACELRCRRCRPFGPAPIALSNCSVDTTYIIRLDVVWQPCAQNT